MSIKWKQESMIKHNECKQYRPSSPIFHHRNQPTSILSPYPTLITVRSLGELPGYLLSNSNYGKRFMRVGFGAIMD